MLAQFSGGGGGFPDPDDGFLQVAGPEWFQYLPISVGSQVLSWAPGSRSAPERVAWRAVPASDPARVCPAALAIYLVVAVGVAIVALNRQEIT